MIETLSTILEQQDQTMATIANPYNVEYARWPRAKSAQPPAAQEGQENSRGTMKSNRTNASSCRFKSSQRMGRGTDQEAHVEERAIVETQVVDSTINVSPINVKETRESPTVALINIESPSPSLFDIGRLFPISCFPFFLPFYFLLNTLQTILHSSTFMGNPSAQLNAKTYSFFEGLTQMPPEVNDFFNKLLAIEGGVF